MHVTNAIVVVKPLIDYLQIELCTISIVTTLLYLKPEKERKKKSRAQLVIGAKSSTRN